MYAVRQRDLVAAVLITSGGSLEELVPLRGRRRTNCSAAALALGIVVDDAIFVGEESLTQFDAGARSPAVRVTLAPAAEAAPNVGRRRNEGRQGK